MGWANPIKPTKKIQKNGLGMVSKNGKPIKINGLRIKPDSNPKNLLSQ